MPLNKKDDGTFKRLYHVMEKEFRDENTGENKQVVQLRRMNARLMLSPENGMESIRVQVEDLFDSELRAAYKLGDFKKGENARTDHRGSRHRFRESARDATDVKN